VVGILGLLTIMTGAAVAYLAKRFPAHIEVLETGARVRETLHLMESLASWTDDMLRLPSSTLLRLMRLGARIQSLLRDAGLLSPEALAFLFQAVWRCLEIAGRTPPWSQPEIEALVRSAAADPQRQALLAAVPRRPEALAAVSRLLATACTPAGAGRTLGRVLASCDPTEAQAVRRQLVQQRDFEILMGEWIEIRDRARQPLDDGIRMDAAVRIVSLEYELAAAHTMIETLRRAAHPPQRGHKE